MGPYFHFQINRSTGSGRKLQKIDLHTEGNKNKKRDRNSKTAIDRDLRFFALVYSYKNTTPLGPNFHFQIDRRMGSGRKLQKIEYMGKKTSNSKTAIDRDLRFFALVCSYKSTVSMGPNFHFQINRSTGSGRKLQKTRY